MITTIWLEIAQSSHAAYYSISRNYSTTLTPPLGSDPSPPPRKIGKKKYGDRRDDQVPISEGDYERIPELLSDYDNIELGDPERNTERPSVVYTKKYPDGVLYGVEVVIEEDKKLHYKTGWKKKP